MLVKGGYCSFFAKLNYLTAGNSGEIQIHGTNELHISQDLTEVNRVLCLSNSEFEIIYTLVKRQLLI